MNALCIIPGCFWHLLKPMEEQELTLPCDAAECFSWIVGVADGPAQGEEYQYDLEELIARAG